MRVCRWPGVPLGWAPNATVVFVHWAPIVLMFMLDLQIWFMLWQAGGRARAKVETT